MTCTTEFQSTSTVYLGHDNTVTVVPYSNIIDRELYDMTDVTSVAASVDLADSTVTGDDITADSGDAPVTVWWEQDVATLEWLIHLKVGMFVGVTAGDYKLRIVIYEPLYPNGIVVTDDTLVTVVDIP